MSRNKWILIVLTPIVVLFAVLTEAWIIISEQSKQSIISANFDSSKWKKSVQENGETAVRLAMVDNLLRQYKLVGMTRLQVDALLDVPPKTDYFHEYDYVYWLGPERGFISIDSEWLCLKFKNDIVIEARILRD